MASQLKISCEGCDYFCNPSPISLEQLSEIIKTNPRIANDIFHLETVKVLCPDDGQVIYAKLG